MTLITSIAIARALGPSKMGYIIYVAWLASVVGTLGSLGIPSTTQKYMAEFLGMGDRLFAVPWSALKLDTANKRFTLNASKEQLKDAPGFDKDHWPAMADATWVTNVHNFYGVKSTGRIQ